MQLPVAQKLYQQKNLISHPMKNPQKNGLQPGRLRWNLRIQPWKRKIIFQTIMSRFYVNPPRIIDPPKSALKFFLKFFFFGHMHLQSLNLRRWPNFPKETNFEFFCGKKKQRKPGTGILGQQISIYASSISIHINNIYIHKYISIKQISFA